MMLKISLRTYLLFFVLIFLAFIALVSRFIPSTQASNKVVIADLIEESMEGVSEYRYDRQGRLCHVAKMQSWLHYKDASISHMLVPTLKVYHPDGSIWHIDAQSGESFHTHLNGRLEKIQLSKDVTIKRQETPQSWLKLKTQMLLFFPNQPLAMTLEPVVVEGPQLKIHAIGMRTHLDRHAIEFLKEVKSSYAAS